MKNCKDNPGCGLWRIDGHICQVAIEAAVVFDENGIRARSLRTNCSRKDAVDFVSREMIINSGCPLAAFHPEQFAESRLKTKASIYSELATRRIRLIADKLKADDISSVRYTRWTINQRHSVLKNAAA